GSPIQVGFEPIAVAVSPDNSRVYVTCTADAAVWALDGTTLQPVGAPVPVGKTPAGVAVAPDSRRIAVVNSGDATVSMIDAATLQPLAPPIAIPRSNGTFPSFAAFSIDGSWLFVVSSTESTGGSL